METSFMFVILFSIYYSHFFQYAAVLLIIAQYGYCILSKLMSLYLSKLRFKSFNQPTVALNIQA